MEIDHIDIRADPTRPPTLTPTAHRCRPITAEVDDSNISRQLKEICKGIDSLILQTLYSPSDDSEEEFDLPTMSDIVNVSSNNRDEILNDLKKGFDASVIDEIEKSTRGQSENQEWFNHRRGRITASVVPSVMTCRFDSNVRENWISREVLGTSSRVSAASLDFGRTHEPIARQMYREQYEILHKSAGIQETGLFIDPSHPFIGASPDGLVSCKCCGEGLLEIKCSYMHQNKTPQEACNDHHYHVYLDENRNVCLKTSSSWYIQVQTQLRGCQKPWCDCILFTKKGFIVDRIYKDSELYESIVARCEKFFFHFIAHALQ